MLVNQNLFDDSFFSHNNKKEIDIDRITSVVTENNETEQGIVLSETPVDVDKRHMIGISRVTAALNVTVDDTVGTKMSPTQIETKEFFVVNPILSDLAILCRLRL